jgi:hypothetical protein
MLTQTSGGVAIGREIAPQRVSIARDFAGERADQDLRVGAALAGVGGVEGAAMIPIPSGVRVWLATGHTDMRRGFPSLALQVQEVLKHDPLGGHLFCFRGRRSDLIKIIWHDSQGACLFIKTTRKRKIHLAFGCR